MNISLQQTASAAVSEDICFGVYGFATRCEAEASPRRYRRQTFTGSVPLIVRAKAIPRAEPKKKESRVRRSKASASHREAKPYSNSLLVKVTFGIVALLLIWIPTSAQEKKSSCIECHLRLEDPKLSAPAKLFDNDIHHARNLSCNDCHGGDPTADTKEAAKDRSKGYLGRPRTLDIPAYCGKCHSDANS